MRALHAPLALAALLAISSPALAAPSAKDRADARALVADARRAIKDKRWPQAVLALKKAAKLDPSPALAMELAGAQIGGGKLIAAGKTLAPLAASTEGAPAARKAREAAKKLLAELQPRIPTVKVRVTGAPAARVTTLVDAVEVEGEGGGAREISLDPGDHTVGATADGFVAVEKEVHVGEGEHEQITLRLARIAPAGATAAGGGGDTRKTGSRVPGAVVTSLGGAGLIVGGVFGALAFSATSSAKAYCTGNVCSSLAGDDLARSKTYGNVSTAAFIGGGALALTGIVLLVAAPGGKPDGTSDDGSRSARVSPWIAPGAAGGMSFGAVGSF